MTDTATIIVTDGCTGFPDGIGRVDWSECCLVHDAGGSDGALLDCVTDAARDQAAWMAPLFALAVFLMILFRPVYNMFQRWGWAPMTPGSRLAARAAMDAAPIVMPMTVVVTKGDTRFQFGIDPPISVDWKWENITSVHGDAVVTDAWIEPSGEKVNLTDDQREEIERWIDGNVLRDYSD